MGGAQLGRVDDTLSTNGHMGVSASHNEMNCIWASRVIMWGGVKGRSRIKNLPKILGHDY